MVSLVQLGACSQRQRAAPLEAVEAAEALEVTVALEVLMTRARTHAPQEQMAVPKRPGAARRRKPEVKLAALAGPLLLTRVVSEAMAAVTVTAQVAVPQREVWSAEAAASRENLCEELFPSCELL